jgi:hypothetical protein
MSSEQAKPEVIGIVGAGPEGPAALYDLEDYLRDQQSIRRVNPPKDDKEGGLHSRRGDFGATALFYAFTIALSIGLLFYVQRIIRDQPGDYRFRLSVGKKWVVLDVQKKATPAENLERALQALAGLGHERADIVRDLVALGYDPQKFLSGK